MNRAAAAAVCEVCAANPARVSDRECPSFRTWACYTNFCAWSMTNDPSIWVHFRRRPLCPGLLSAGEGVRVKQMRTREQWSTEAAGTDGRHATCRAAPAPPPRHPRSTLAPPHAVTTSLGACRPLLPTSKYLNEECSPAPRRDIRWDRAS